MKFAPALAAQRQLELPLLAGIEQDRPCRPSFDAQARRQRHEQLEAVDPDAGEELDRRRDLVALQRAVAVERHADGDVGLAPGHRRDEREHERSGERDRLHPAEGQAGHEPGRRERGIRGHARRDEPGHASAVRNAVLGGRRRHRLERLLHDVLAAEPLHPELRLHHQPVRECRHGDGLHVVRSDEVAPGERRLRARELEQGEAAARARADGEPPRLARRRHEIDDVALDRVGDVHLLERLLQLDERRPVDDRLELHVVHAALEAALEHLDLVLALRVADRDAHEEPVELRLGQGIRPLVLDRVLRREHEERRLEPVRRVLDRHLALLHRLEQRRLRLRRGAVDLVGEQEVGEDGAGPEDELGRPLVEDLRARDVARHQVGRELDAREAEGRRLRERARDQRLGEPRVVLQQHVAVAQQREQDQLERPSLAHDGLLDLVEDQLRVPAHVGERGHSDSTRSIAAATCSRGTPGPCRSAGGGRSGRSSSHASSPSSACCRVGPPVELDAAARGEPRRRRRPQQRQEPAVGVGRIRDPELELPLHAQELHRRLGRLLPAAESRLEAAARAAARGRHGNAGRAGRGRSRRRARPRSRERATSTAAAARAGPRAATAAMTAGTASRRASLMRQPAPTRAARHARR